MWGGEGTKKERSRKRRQRPAEQPGGMAWHQTTKGNALLRQPHLPILSDEADERDGCG